MNATRNDFGSKLGDVGFEVEWCSHIPPLYPGSDEGDMDQATYNFRDFMTIEEARVFAKEIYPEDAFGCVKITPFEIVRLSDEYPYGKTREHTGDGETYDGD